MKLPRDLSGTDVARRVARHYYGCRVARSGADILALEKKTGGLLEKIVGRQA